MIRRHIATVLMLAAVAAPSASGGPAPEELWREFPLEPPPATTPAQAPVAPAPIAPLEPPALPTREATEVEADKPGFLVWLGAAAPTIVALGSLFLIAIAAAYAAAAALRRREWREQAAAAGPVPGGDPAVGEIPDDLVDRVRAATGALPVPAERSRSSVPFETAPSPTAEYVGIDASSVEECEIACRLDAEFWHFHVVSHGQIVDAPISTAFDAPGHRAPDQTDTAVRAYEGLAQKLIDSGWEEEGRGEAWFATRFRRLSA